MAGEGTFFKWKLKQHAKLYRYVQLGNQGTVFDFIFSHKNTFCIPVKTVWSNILNFSGEKYQQPFKTNGENFVMYFHVRIACLVKQVKTI